jgi:hypothetical protein
MKTRVAGCNVWRYRRESATILTAPCNDKLFIAMYLNDVDGAFMDLGKRGRTVQNATVKLPN